MEKLLFNPDGFFDKKTKEKTSLKQPFIIVTINGIITLISSILIMNLIISKLPQDVHFFGILGIFIGSLGSLITTFFVWIIITSIFYLISYFFNTDGSYKKLLEFVGFGFIPLIFFSFISLIITISIISSATFNIPLQNPESSMLVFVETMAKNPINLISRIAAIPLYLWSGFIWVFAVKHARNLTGKNALIVVGIPLGSVIIFMIFSILNEVL